MRAAEWDDDDLITWAIAVYESETGAHGKPTQPAVVVPGTQISGSRRAASP